MKHTRQIGNIVLPSLPPRPNMHRFPELKLAEDTLPAHNASLQSLKGFDAPRPNANLPKIPIINVPRAKIGAENFAVALPTNHSVHESFGGSPRWEAEQMGYRPTNPRSFSMAPVVTMKAQPKQVPIRETTILPKANMPNLHDFSKVGPANPMTIELKATTPNVRPKDISGLLSSTSKFGGIGQSAGKSFGAESFISALI